MLLLVNYLIWIAFTLILGVLIKCVFITSRIYFQYKRRYGQSVLVLFYPILGLSYFMGKSLREDNDGYYFLKRLVRAHPKARAVLILSGLFDYLILLDNDWIQLVSQDQHLFYKDDGCFAYDQMFGEGLLFTDNSSWKRQRMILGSAFHFKALKQMLSTIKTETKHFCSFLLKQQSQSNLNKENCIVKEQNLEGLRECRIQPNVFKEVQVIVSEIIAQIFFGHSLKEVKCANGKELSTEFNELVNQSYFYRLTSPFFILKAFFLGNTKASTFLNSRQEKCFLTQIDHIYRLVQDIIQKRKLTMMRDPNNPIPLKEEQHLSVQTASLLDIYLREYLKGNKGITEREIVHQYLTFLFAGSDTISQLVSMALFELSRNERVISKLKEEMTNNKFCFDSLKFSDLTQYSYLDLILSETARLHCASAFTFPRRTRQHNYSRDDLYISEHVLVSYKLVQFNNQTSVLKDADQFNPERFSINQSQSSSTFDFIPFSTGPRNCIGQHLALLEAKIIILYVVSHFRLSPIPNYKLQMIQQVINMPIQKIMFQIQKI